MEMQLIVSFLTKVVLFIGLYLLFVWILTLLNSFSSEDKHIKNWPSVTILIPTYNEEKSIKRTIKSVLKSDYKGILKILVVDDGSKDKTIQVVKDLIKRENINNLEILELKRNYGKAGAINKALPSIKTNFFAVLDADCIIERNTIKNAIQEFYEYNNENFVVNKKIGAVICHMRPYNDSKTLLEMIQGIEYMVTSFIRYLLASQMLLHMTNAGSFYRTNLIKKLKGFDDKNLTEDFEIGVRLRKNNYAIVYSRKSRLYTLVPSKLKVFLKQRIRWARGFIQTHIKHKDIFFNKKYGFFGLYQFPMNIIGLIIFYTSIYLIAFKLYKKTYEFIFKLIYTPSLIKFNFFDFKDFILTYNTRTDLIITFNFVFYLMIVYFVLIFFDYNYFRHKPFKKFIAFLIYLLLFNYLYVYIWIYSLIIELRKKKYDWGTK